MAVFYSTAPVGFRLHRLETATDVGYPRTIASNDKDVRVRCFWVYIVLSIRLHLSELQVYGINCRRSLRNGPTRLAGAPEISAFWVHWFDVRLRSGEQRKLSG